MSPLDFDNAKAYDKQLLALDAALNLLHQNDPLAYELRRIYRGIVSKRYAQAGLDIDLAVDTTNDQFYNRPNKP